MTPDLSFECNAPDVVFENFGDEVILLNLRTGNYFSLDPLAMFYWEYLSQGVPPREIAAHVSGFYAGSVDGASIAGDLDALFAEFVEGGLVRPSQTIRAFAAITTTAKLSPRYASPAISRFDDVSEMLLLDPVHDVSDVGWPSAAPLDPPASASLAEDHGGE